MVTTFGNRFVGAGTWLQRLLMDGSSTRSRSFRTSYPEYISDETEDLQGQDQRMVAR